VRTSLLALAGSLVLAIAAPGCVLSPIDLGTRECPCDDGWTCDNVLRICVRGGLDAGMRLDAGPRSDASGLDAGSLDAEITDASPMVLDAAETDAGPPDSGPPDSGRPDAGPPDAGPTECERLGPTAWICDDFEADLSMWEGPLIEGRGAIAQSSTAAHGGIRSVRAETLEAGARARLGSHAVPDVGSGRTIWARGWFRIPTMPAIDGVSVLYVGSDVGASGIAMQLRADGLVAGWIGPAEPDMEPYFESSARLTPGVWTCLEMRIDVADPGGAVEFFVDGVSVVRRNPVDTTVGAGPYDVAQVGIEYSTPLQAPIAIQVDDVAFGPARIPCR
jgi:hypothetical protein